MIKTNSATIRTQRKDPKMTLSLVCLCWSYDNKRCERRYGVVGLPSVSVVQSERVKMGDAGTTSSSEDDDDLLLMSSAEKWYLNSRLKQRRQFVTYSTNVKRY